MMHAPEAPDATAYPEITTLDVRRLPHVQRQPLLFAAFRQLAAGQAFRLVNDHDPVPLYGRLMAAFPGLVAWEYIEQGPEVWQVRIGKRPTSGSLDA